MEQDHNLRLASTGPPTVCWTVGSSVASLPFLHTLGAVANDAMALDHSPDQPHTIRGKRHCTHWQIRQSASHC